MSFHDHPAKAGVTGRGQIQPSVVAGAQGAPTRQEMV